MSEEKTVDTPEKSPTPKDDKKRFVTFGETFQKWSTYLSIDWGLNYMTGVGFAMWGEYTKLGQNTWGWLVNKTANFLSKDVMKLEGEALKLGNKNFIRFASVIAGGMFTIPPLMILESKKVRKSMIQWYDKMYYGKDKVENDPKFAEAYAALDNVPKQGFWTGLISRIGALAPLLAAVWIPPLRKATHSQDYLDWVGKGSKHAYNAAGLTEERLFRKQSPAERAKRWEFLHENSAMDFGLEPMYAVLHMIMYRGLAKMVGGHKEKANERKEHLVQQPSPGFVTVDEEGVPSVTRFEEPKKAKADETPLPRIQQISRDEHMAQVSSIGQLGAS